VASTPSPSEGVGKGDPSRLGLLRRAAQRTSTFVHGGGSIPPSEHRALLDLAILSGITAFLLSLFTPDLILSKTTATGGDMAAHIYTPWYLRHHLLPRGLLAGWSPGWYAGFPMLHFYFPLVPTFQALLSFVMPHEVAFKLGTVLGTFFLPGAAYAACRLLRLPWPTPTAAAVLTLGFLFMDSFRLAGGNIASSLVGEYSYAVSLGLTLVFLGLAYRLAVEDRPWPLAAALVLALAALSHLVTVMIVVALSPVLVGMAVRRLGARAALTRFCTVYGLAFALTAFWSIPFVVRLPYTTNMNWIQREGWDLLAPRESWLYLAGAAAACVVLLVRRDARILVLAGPGLIGAAAYFAVPDGHIYNERFTPHWFVGIVLCCAYFLGFTLPLLARLAGARRGALVCSSAVVALLIGQTAWLLHDRKHTFVDEWVEGNYKGYEGQPDFPTFQRLTAALAALPEGRVLWEPSPELQRFGSTVALMSLPYFADQPSMEGIYFESSPTTPFHFLMASELSQEPSRPIAGLPYPDFDLERGVSHLQLYDVAYYVTYSTEARRAARGSDRLEHVATVDEFAIFAVGGPGQVIVPNYEPVVLTGAGWLEENLEWFAHPVNLGTPLVREGPPGWRRVATAANSLPRTRLPHGGDSFEAEMTDGEITFETAALGEPHWIKTSYFPNWKVEGAEGPYLASPSLMIVVPTEERVRLYYARTWAEWTGLVVTVTALVFIAIPALRRRIRGFGAIKRAPGPFPPRSPTSAGPRT
jgi:hypothetical protein